METEDKKRLVRRFYEELWGNGSPGIASEMFAPDYVRHDLRATAALQGPEGQVKIALDFRAAFPDLRITVDLLVAEDDYVAARWTMHGTNGGRWAGFEPTGKTMRFAGVNIFRFADGKVVELWNHRDDLGLREQLGIPLVAGAAPS